MEFQHNVPLNKDANCPNCGWDGHGHITVFDNQRRIGRQCGCGYTWPINISTVKEVSFERFAEFLELNKDDEYQLYLKGWQVPILHGLVALAADHPGIKNMHDPTHQVINKVKQWCCDIFSLWGFSPDEVEYLDKMREEASKKHV